MLENVILLEWMTRDASFANWGTSLPNTYYIMATKNYSDILNEVVEIDLNYYRVNDISISDDTFHLTIEEDQKDEDNSILYLTGESGEKFKITVRQLAALRIFKGTSFKGGWLHEFKSMTDCAIFKTEAVEIAKIGVKTLDQVIFKCVGQLKIANDFSAVPDMAIYKDSSYEGAQAYVQGVRTLTRGKAADFWSTIEYRMGSKELRSALHSTPLKAGAQKDENLVLLPVFSVS